ncbi:Unknown protein [Striga hermonthica]|uniref:YDG domain-containing protein n=1 Tax=Striga hermonthica TaxID=68872 RepID=A0A9N7RGJ8_STRHE|nr:Unknown protein [Striga hermonthica]
MVVQLPCDGNGVCMVCGAKGETLSCKTWHIICLAAPPETLSEAAQGDCPDCSGAATESDELLSGTAGGHGDVSDDKDGDAGGLLGLLGDKFNCSICMQLLDKPVSVLLNVLWLFGFLSRISYSLGGFNDLCGLPPIFFSGWLNFPRQMFQKASQRSIHLSATKIVQTKLSLMSMHEKLGRLMHAVGRYLSQFLLIILVQLQWRMIHKESWDGQKFEDRMECRQWGAHFPHVAGICGQADHDVQSVLCLEVMKMARIMGIGSSTLEVVDVILAGIKGQTSYSLPTRHLQNLMKLCESVANRVIQSVARSHREKRSSFAPQDGYDGIYRIEKCWRKNGAQALRLWRNSTSEINNELYNGYNRGNSGGRINEIVAGTRMLIEFIKEMPKPETIPGFTWIIVQLFPVLGMANGKEGVVSCQIWTKSSPVPSLIPHNSH